MTDIPLENLSNHDMLRDCAADVREIKRMMAESKVREIAREIMCANHEHQITVLTTQITERAQGISKATIIFASGYLVSVLTIIGLLGKMAHWW